MSNKIVDPFFLSQSLSLKSTALLFDEVIASIKPEFDEYGVSEDILAELQHKWESKVIASHVAEFEPPAQAPAAAPPPPHVQPTQHSYPQHPMHMNTDAPPFTPTHYAAHMAAVATAATTAPGQPQVKAEPVDTRYMLPSYTLPPLPGPNVTAARPPVLPPHPGGQAGVISFARPAQTQQSSSAPARPMLTDLQSRLMTTESPSPPSTAFAPRTMHPSLPQPVTASQRQQTPVDSEAINSDLDDSDSDNEEEADEGGVGESDIVFCTYDKVARVKNKWKCVLKDGMISC
ncbi:hypothetical protein FA13DRAFT_1807176 [Coprinellus micaceus]|uniref:Transcription factor IIA, alpha/beta subunit n=1 Tax=Coprinellus micaceus TaxID=71717 RepID=A0A4Y7RDC9_COPMI|nr:hypothetical protein FA13DRAFT_1807176 [Coprinellus micaceus]